MTWEIPIGPAGRHTNRAFYGSIRMTSAGPGTSSGNDTRTRLARPSESFSSPAATDDALDTTWDLVVVGAGLTGITTALLLARAGRAVLVLEARDSAPVPPAPAPPRSRCSRARRSRRWDAVRRPVSCAPTSTATARRRPGSSRYAEEHAVAFQRRTAYTYATSAAGASSAREELEAARGAGLPCGLGLRDDRLPVPGHRRGRPARPAAGRPDGAADLARRPSRGARRAHPGRRHRSRRQR